MSGQDDNGSHGGRKKKKRARRVRRMRTRKTDEEIKKGNNPQDEDDMKGTTGTGAAGRVGVKVVVDDLPDKVMHHVVDFLAIPESDDDQRYPGSYSYLSNLTSMAQVCHRWKKVVRSSGVWKVICEQRWPWLQPGDMERLELVSNDPRRRAVKGNDASKWMELFSDVGRCLGWWAISLPRDIRMMVDVNSNGRRLLSKRGFMSSCRLNYEDYGWFFGSYMHKPIWRLETAEGLEDHRVRFWPLQDELGVRSSDQEAIVQGLIGSTISVHVLLVDGFTKRKACLSFQGLFYPEMCEDEIDHPVSYIHGPEQRKKLVSGQPVYFSPRIYVKPVEGQEFHKISFTLMARCPGSPDLDNALRSLNWV